MSRFQQLAENLSAKGIHSYLQTADDLIVANTNPALPSSNCFRVFIIREVWYIATFLPAVYELAPGTDIAEVCEKVFKSSKTAIYAVDPNLATSLNLRRLEDAELNALGIQ